MSYSKSQLEELGDSLINAHVPENFITRPESAPALMRGFSAVRTYAEDYYDGVDVSQKNYERSRQEENSNLRDYELAY